MLLMFLRYSACLVVCFASTLVEAKMPHIVLIMADDMGYGDPTCYNPNSKITTKHIDRLAAEGMRFTDAHSPAAVCVPTRYGLMTGRYPFRMPNVERHKPRINRGRTTIASLLRDQGYETQMVGKWHLGFDFDDISEEHRRGPVDNGFDSYFGIPRSLDIPPYYYLRDRLPVAPPTGMIAANNSVEEGWTPIQGAFWREGALAPGFRHIDVLPRFSDEAVAVIDAYADSNSENRLFLYFALPAPHTPWLPTEEYSGKSGAGMYGDFAQQVDDCIGRVLDALDRHEMTDETLVIFTSDNGPVWYPHDTERFDHASTGPLRGMKGDAWEAGHRMPFIVRWPGTVTAGTMSDQLICHVDLMATFADILNATLPKGEGLDSVNLLPALVDHPDRTTLRKTLISQSSKEVLGFRKGPWKLIPTRGSGGFTRSTDADQGPEGQLYNLDDDLGETTNLWDDHPQIVEELTLELAKAQAGVRTAPE
ncbi:MAG: arylsulfatase [Planctomycetaceae bacterium]|nr:arylsulfatase [Planctomycetaceae bacterium]